MLLHFTAILVLGINSQSDPDTKFAPEHPPNQRLKRGFSKISRACPDVMLRLESNLVGQGAVLFAAHLLVAGRPDGATLASGGRPVLAVIRFRGRKQIHSSSQPTGTTKSTCDRRRLQVQAETARLLQPGQQQQQRQQDLRRR
uniref:Secreted protein n=1 Tax=Coccidioides posadasii RMSCC 3488 TaxID=454284 RepID=A0A0J6FRM7_COCPO|nr:hypothetical protein CPAG_08002 [Coccidioides posadasii RMSCC 3488]